jgi:hypothetical protein
MDRPLDSRWECRPSLEHYFIIRVGHADEIVFETSDEFIEGQAGWAESRDDAVITLSSSNYIGKKCGCISLEVLTSQGFIVEVAVLE